MNPCKWNTRDEREIIYVERVWEVGREVRKECLVWSWRSMEKSSPKKAVEASSLNLFQSRAGKISEKRLVKQKSACTTGEEWNASPPWTPLILYKSHQSWVHTLFASSNCCRPQCKAQRGHISIDMHVRGSARQRWRSIGTASQGSSGGHFDEKRCPVCWAVKIALGTDAVWNRKLGTRDCVVKMGIWDSLLGWPLPLGSGMTLWLNSQDQFEHGKTQSQHWSC